MRVLVSIVTWNHQETIAKAIGSVLSQETDVELSLSVIDNNSTDQTREVLSAFQQHPRVNIDCLPINLGFSGGHNRSAYSVLAGDFDALLLLNPDAALLSGCVDQCAIFSQRYPNDFIVPTLLRADPQLQPFIPEVIDSAGIVWEKSFRHLDRFAELERSDAPSRVAKVLGGSGAALWCPRFAIEKLTKNERAYERDSERVYPQLSYERVKRVMFLDEGFFAYREDAELALRSFQYGIDCYSLPLATIAHVRRVTPERRNNLPAEINTLGVRNRFLLHLSSTLFPLPMSLIVGMWLRHCVVFCAVLFKERSSLQAFFDLYRLFRRGRERRQCLYRERVRTLRTWYEWKPREI